VRIFSAYSKNSGISVIHVRNAMQRAVYHRDAIMPRKLRSLRLFQRMLATASRGHYCAEEEFTAVRWRSMLLAALRNYGV